MIRQRTSIEHQDREAFRSASVFLEKRLAEQGTLDWALRLEPTQHIERIALENLLHHPGAEALDEPWASAWRLVEESWSNGSPNERGGMAIFDVQRRLRTGDRSGAAIAAIVNLVRPQLLVVPIETRRWSYSRKPGKPKVIGDVLSARLTSGDLIDLNVLELSQLDNATFLTSLASSLEAAVINGLDIAHRVGWSENRSFLGLGLLSRVYYTQPMRRGGGDGEDSEPDAYHQGIAPSVKLLHAVVDRLSAIDLDAARPFVARWKSSPSTVFVRLWSAMARSAQLVLPDEVASFLGSLTDRLFWDLNDYPEIAELRALRFKEFDLQSQTEIAARLMKGPPRNLWPRKVDSDKVEEARQYWAARELRRIEIAGGDLPPRPKKWLDDRLPQSVELERITIEEGFPEGVTVRSASRVPDRQYDDLKGIARLEALEKALATSRRGWNDDPAERASDWINQPGNTEHVLADLEDAEGGDGFPRVWNRFGWAHRPQQTADRPVADARLLREAARVLVLMDKLSQSTLDAAIEGICAWLDAWGKRAVASPLMLPIWRRLWPLAVQATNRDPEPEDQANLSVIAPPLDDETEPKDLDTLNTPAGKLVGVFLSACPKLTPDQIAFAAGSTEREMRDTVVEAEGRSGLIAKHRMIEELRYFLKADRAWAEQHLVAPLQRDDGTALPLWRAVARRTQFEDVLQIIGSRLTERVIDRRLGRETRRSLVFSLVVEALYAFRDNRPPAVPNERLQQALRMMDDEVRASAANTVQQFIRDLSADSRSKKGRRQTASEKDEKRPTAAELFRCAAAPFLEQVWPREQSLTTPGVSRAFADLPATSGAAFPEAVEAIEPFLVPFECWSMLDFGLFGEEGGHRRLTFIDSTEKAKALLKLLDLTVGAYDGAVIPYDISEALGQIAKMAPALSNTKAFRRLEAAARR